MSISNDKIGTSVTEHVNDREANLSNHSTRVTRIITDDSTRQSIRNLATTLECTTQESIDEERLQNAVRDTGCYTYGIRAVEVWELKENKLVRPKGGYWRKHADCLLSDDGYLDKTVAENLERLENENHPNYLPPDPVMPGVDLAGELWKESTSILSGNTIKHHMTQSSSRAPTEVDETYDEVKMHEDVLQARDLILRGNRSFSRSFRGAMSKSLDSRLLFSKNKKDNASSKTAEFSGPTVSGGDDTNIHIIWRDVESLLKDPFIPKSPRMKAFYDAGLNKAAGIPFNHGGHKGIVIFFTSHQAKQRNLEAIENILYMQSSVEVIGAVIASIETRRASIALQRRLQNPASVSERNENSNTALIDETWKHGKHLRTWALKCHGGDLQVPPPMPSIECLWTFSGVFFTLLALTSLNEYVLTSSRNDYYLILGPFGALMTLQYGLTAAPVAQPRNIMFGQLISYLVAGVFDLIPEDIISVSFRTAIVPAIVISLMTRLGVTHPPAGAAAVVYASGKFGWGVGLIFLGANMITIVLSTFINNSSNKRQYPTHSWKSFKLYM